MKYWLSHLPLEVWVDVFCYPWKSREEIGQIVDKFTNHTFVEYLQFYLHDWGKQKLHGLDIDKEGMYKYKPGHVHPRGLRFLDIPQTPMPANIKSFDCLSISHFNAQTLNFLRQIQPILANVNLHLWGINNAPESSGIVLAHLLPMLDGIHSLTFNIRAVPTIEQCFTGEQLAQIKVLQIDSFFDAFPAPVTPVNFILNWLTSPAEQHNNNNNNDGPKLCELRVLRSPKVCGLGYSPPDDNGLSAAIREQFLAATHPSTFALIDHDNRKRSKDEFEFHLENNLGEELHSKMVGYYAHQIITRHKANCGTELEEWVKENTHCHRGRIEINEPTIGEINAAKDGPENAKEDEQQKPSTSKEA